MYKDFIPALIAIIVVIVGSISNYLTQNQIFKVHKKHENKRQAYINIVALKVSVAQLYYSFLQYYYQAEYLKGLHYMSVNDTETKALLYKYEERAYTLMIELKSTEQKLNENLALASLYVTDKKIGDIIYDYLLAVPEEMANYYLNLKSKEEYDRCTLEIVHVEIKIKVLHFNSQIDNIILLLKNNLNG